MPRRTDSNQADVVKCLRKLGYRVQDLSRVGKGCPDLLVGAPWGQLFAIEVKGARGKLTPDQVEWHDDWRRMRPIVARSVAEAVQAMNAERLGSTLGVIPR